MYRKLTSKVASIVSLVICNDSMNSTKVSLMYEGSCFTAGWRYVSRNLEMFRVAAAGNGSVRHWVLCVFFRKYMLVLMFWIRVVVGSMFGFCRLSYL